MFIHHNFKRRALTAALLFAPLALALANTTQEVERVTGTVSLSSPTDYVVTSPTPFATGAVVDIADTEHAVLILKHVKPSVAGSLLSHVRIGGQAAVAGTNCQVRIYANGSIVMPYAKTVSTRRAMPRSLPQAPVSRSAASRSTTASAASASSEAIW